MGKARERAPELIDGRAIESREQDELLHAGFADELAELLRAVSPPANVALFGSWGSGKSGLGKLLVENLDGKSGIRCVVYDAFKYAQFPLRRHFISQVAAELKIFDDEFHDGLYREESRTSLKMPPSRVGAVLGLFALAGAAAMAVFFALAYVVASLLDGPTQANFETTLKSGPLLLMTPAALLAAFVALSNKWIPFDYKRSRPDSEEQFEKCFKKLVKTSRASRLVVFIDELDRCSPKEVVDTLETMRTFLEVAPCVFVVAADQAVLERALCVSLEQATPIDRVNPYVSAGSEYLDKVFGYQIAVPPLMPRRLTGYATRLLANREGIWDEVDHDEVVSALIPLHVRSPRRVKTLLNAFVSTYRMARKRHQEGVLQDAPKDRASEIAKLVCLRHEFPGFAAELIQDAQFPTYVLAIADLVRANEEWAAERPEQVREDLWERAHAYADGKQPVDVYLSASDDDGEEHKRRLGDVQRRHGDLLVNYLRSQRLVPGPARDLVHLESGGEVYGLSAAFADDLELTAVSGDTGEVVAQIEQLDSDDSRRAALRLLARRSREAEMLSEKANALAAMAAAAVSMADHVSEAPDE